jgi:adenylate kinase family enzyme
MAKEIRIHILGGPGSGKTSLARYLASRFGIPHYDLDQFGSKNGLRIEDFIADASAIAEQTRWVTEGIYLIWTDPLLYRADYIVLLDVPLSIAVWRIIRRHIRRSLHGTNPYPGLNGVRLLFKLVQFAIGYYTEKASSPSLMAALHDYFEPGPDDEQPPGAEVLLRRIEACGLTIPWTSDFVRLYLERYRGKVIVIKDKEDRRRLLELIMQLNPAMKASGTS